MSRVSLDKLNQAHNKRFKAKKIQIECEGQKFEVKVDLVFKDSKVRDLIAKTAEDMEKAQSEDLLDELLVISNMNIIRVFTDVEFTNDLTKNLQMFEVMHDLGIVETILNTFEESELDKIVKYMGDLQENLPKVLEAMKEANPNVDVEKLLSGDFDGNDSTTT